MVMTNLNLTGFSSESFDEMHNYLQHDDQDNVGSVRDELGLIDSILVVKWGKLNCVFNLG